VCSTVVESLQVVVHSEALQLTCLLVFYHVESLVTSNPVVEGSRRGLNLDGAIRKDLRSTPAVFSVPVAHEHVVSEDLAEGLSFKSSRLDLLDVNLLNLKVSCSESAGFAKVSATAGEELSNTEFVN